VMDQASLSQIFDDRLSRTYNTDQSNNIPEKKRYSTLRAQQTKRKWAIQIKVPVEMASTNKQTERANTQKPHAKSLGEKDYD